MDSKYKLYGLDDKKLKVLKDISNIYEISPLEIQGYGTLTRENKNIYKHFIINFFNSWDLDTRKTIKPLSINDVEEIKYLGNADPDDPEYFTILIHELYVIKNDSTKELLKRLEYKENSMKIKDTVKDRYLRFEYEIHGIQEWIHVLNDEDWY